ncbi:MAG TPA: polysaccharide biosynthesis/export family protein [Chthoniobacterales bacterium]|jgi:polysaccharide export outer membrane protein|nr:polysaccharide biosynthesis/export family protein [Chthoniobacterales bacterium]
MKNRIVLLELIFAGLFTVAGVNAQTGVAPRAEAVVPQQAPPSAVAPQAPSSTLDNYILSPNDIVLVKVFEDPDLDSQHRISQDGTINFPLIGIVQISGRTVMQAASTIRDRLLKGYLRNPQVRVNVIQYASRRITVLGQVQKPGSYVLPNEERVDLLQAIAMAGGFTRLADEGRVLVRRNVNGVDTILKVNVHAETKNSSSQLFEVQPDDRITVRERIF